MTRNRYSVSAEKILIPTLKIFFFQELAWVYAVPFQFRESMRMSECDMIDVKKKK